MEKHGKIIEKALTKYWKAPNSIEKHWKHIENPNKTWNQLKTKENVWKSTWSRQSESAGGRKRVSQRASDRGQPIWIKSRSPDFKVDESIVDTLRFAGARFAQMVRLDLSDFGIVSGSMAVTWIFMSKEKGSSVCLPPRASLPVALRCARKDRMEIKNQNRFWGLDRV